MSGFFVTGTDTGVGKTVVTAALCAATGAIAMKPVQTGASADDDLRFVESATGRAGPPDLTCLYRFEEPLAPSVAAQRAGVAIDPERIVSAYRALAATGPVVVEGAGGILVEIADQYTMAALASALGLRVLIVCRPSLGTLNHTALTLEAARNRGLDVAGLVISGWQREPGLAERTNPARLSRMAPLAGVIPALQGLDTAALAPASLAAAAKEFFSPELGGTFDAAAFLERL